MKADISRDTFRKKKHYRKVNMQQGRVQVDSDWNEQVDIEVHHEKASLRDLMGGSGAPAENPGFGITATNRGYKIGKGRYYVDGILCENEESIEGFDQPDLPPNIRIDYPTGPSVYSFPMESGEYLAYLHVWQQHLTALDDPNIRESALGGADTGTRTKNVWQVQLIKIQDGGFIRLNETIVATARIDAQQPDETSSDLEPVLVPIQNGQDPGREISIEFMNARQQGVFGIIEIKDPSANKSSAAKDIIAFEMGVESQDVVVKTKAEENDNNTGMFYAELTVKDGLVLVGGKVLGRVEYGAMLHASYIYEILTQSRPTCLSNFSEWESLVRPSDGSLKARAQPEQQSDQPCIMTPQAKYTNLENQLYRVEIHNGGVIGSGDNARPTFKFSRDNGVVVTSITKMESGKITVANSGKDSYLGLAPFQWVEVIDDRRDLWGIPGSMVRLDNVQENELTFTPGMVKGDPITDANFPKEFNPKVRRWDSEGVMEAHVPSENAGYLSLESGIQIRFEEGMVRNGDYWLIPARTLKRDVEWPKTTENEPTGLAPEGITHYFSRLAILRHLYTPDEPIIWDDVTDNGDSTNMLKRALIRRFLPAGTKAESVNVKKVAGTEFESIKVTADDNSLFITLNDKKPLATFAILSIGSKALYAFLVWRGDDNVLTIFPGDTELISDCRRMFPPATDLTSILYYVSGDGQQLQGRWERVLKYPLVAGVARGNKPLNGFRVHV